MTTDYTKISKQKAPQPIKAHDIQASTVAQATPRTHELEERICTQCYWVGRPRIIESGSWLGYILPMFFDEPISLYGCRECNHPTSMVPLDSHEGQQAMYWHLKRNNPKGSTSKTQF